MNKASSLKKVNAGLALVFFLQAGTGIGHSLIPHEIFEKVHPLIGMLLVLFGILHIYLNWPWFMSNWFRRNKPVQ